MSYFQLHYFLIDQSHSIDAITLNKAEGELLKIFKEVIHFLELENDISFEITALEEGGIKAFYKFLSKKKTKKTVKKALIYIGGMLTIIIPDIISDNIKKDHEYEQLQKEEIKLRIEKLKKDLEHEEKSESEKLLIINDLSIYMLENDKIKLFKSNFYSTLLNEEKIKQISTQLLDEEKVAISTEKFVLRESFDNFIIHKIEIEPDYRQQETIEIVAPVLREKNLKWKGIYNGKTISFNLRDIEFRKSVLKGDISFSSGISIICDIELEQIMNDNGEITVESINIYNVTDILTENKTIETPRKKRNKELSNQTKLELE